MSLPGSRNRATRPVNEIRKRPQAQEASRSAADSRTGATGLGVPAAARARPLHPNRRYVFSSLLGAGWTAPRCGGASSAHVPPGFARFASTRSVTLPAASSRAMPTRASCRASSGTRGERGLTDEPTKGGTRPRRSARRCSDTSCNSRRLDHLMKSRQVGAISRRRAGGLLPVALAAGVGLGARGARGAPRCG